MTNHLVLGLCMHPWTLRGYQLDSTGLLHGQLLGPTIASAEPLLLRHAFKGLGDSTCLHAGSVCGGLLIDYSVKVAASKQPGALLPDGSWEAVITKNRRARIWGTVGYVGCLHAVLKINHHSHRHDV